MSENSLPTCPHCGIPIPPAKPPITPTVAANLPASQIQIDISTSIPK